MYIYSGSVRFAKVLFNLIGDTTLTSMQYICNHVSSAYIKHILYIHVPSGLLKFFLYIPLKYYIIFVLVIYMNTRRCMNK